MRCWKRVLQVRFSSADMPSLKPVVFGSGRDNLTISVSGQKVMSVQKDNFVIQLKNIPTTSSSVVKRNDVGEITDVFIDQSIANYSIDQVALILGGYTDVEVVAGYEEGNIMTVFKGYVVYMSEKMEDDGKTSTLYVVCSSALTFKSGDKISMTCSKGTNLYSVINYVCKRYRINADIDRRLKLRGLSEDLVFDDNLMSAIYAMQREDVRVAVNVDKTDGGFDFQFWDMTTKDIRHIHIKKEMIVFSDGFPTITQEGLSLSVMPTFNFKPGDVIKIDDQSLIQMTQTSLSGYMQTPNLTQFYDANGEYIIHQININLENRGNAFKFQMICKSKSLFSNITNK